MNDRSTFDADLVAVLPELTAYARSRLRDFAAADDLVQMAALKAMKNWEQFERGTNFRAWMYRILTNEMISEHRRKKPTVSLDDETTGVMAVQAARQDEQMDQQNVHRMLALLPPAWRHVLVSICVEGRTYEEAAAEIGVTVGTIKSRLWRARTLMEQLLVR